MPVDLPEGLAEVDATVRRYHPPVHVGDEVRLGRCDGLAVRTEQRAQKRRPAPFGTENKNGVHTVCPL